LPGIAPLTIVPATESKKRRKQAGKGQVSQITRPEQRKFQLTGYAMRFFHHCVDRLMAFAVETPLEKAPLCSATVSNVGVRLAKPAEEAPLFWQRS